MPTPSHVVDAANARVYEEVNEAMRREADAFRVYGTRMIDLCAHCAIQRFLPSESIFSLPDFFRQAAPSVRNINGTCAGCGKTGTEVFSLRVPSNDTSRTPTVRPGSIEPKPAVQPAPRLTVWERLLSDEEVIVRCQTHSD